MTKTIKRRLPSVRSSVSRPASFAASLLCVTLFAGVLTNGYAQAGGRPVPNPQLDNHDLNARVEKLLKQMTLEEKIGQTVQYSAGFATGPAGTKVSYDELTEKGAIGSMLNVYGAEKTNHYQHIAMEKARLHIPILFGMDVIHGYRTTFPAPLALSCSWDAKLVEGVARTSGAEARAEGVAWAFSPMVDISRDARWGRIVESAGEDPYLGSAIARGWVKGYQQGDLTKPDSVAVSVKHFAAYGAAIAGRDYNATDMSDITLRQVYLPPYHAAVDAGAATVMSSFNTINGVPGTANPYTLTQILRKEWGFNGLVVSDWGAVGELLNHAIGPDGSTVARKALTAGVDMDMEGNLYGTTIAAQVRAGVIPESVVDEAARRILRVKFAMGLFEHPYTQVGAAWEPTAEKRAQARAVADETIVLLKNDAVEGVGALLPLAKSAKTVALIGPLADDAKDMLGSWATLGDPKYAVSLKQALSERLGDKLLYAKGTEILTGKDAAIIRHVSFVDANAGNAGAKEEPAPDDDATIAEAVAVAKKADVAIVAVGESADWMTGEASSRVNIGLPGHQEQLLEAVAATGKPVILVMFTGRPTEVKWAGAHVPAIVEAWFPGMEGGHAVADILFGDVNPSAKLTTSFPRAVGQEPLYYAQMPTGRPAGHVDLTHLPSNSVEKFVSRYVDEENSALFPFGWGLSYTRFNYGSPTVSKASISVADAGKAGAVTVSVDVKNTGSVAGTEVVQLYVRNTSASVEQPVRELKGFERVTLAPGESKHVTFPLGFDELSFYNVESKRVVGPTAYKVWVGGSSLADAEAGFEVK